MTDSPPLVLYVDDERPNRVVFEQSFGKQFPIRCVSSAEEALELMKRERVGVLVTDQRMPGMGGNELLERAKTLYPDVVRVVITAFSDLDPILRAVNEGLVARYIVKPWDRAQLRELLAWGLETYEVGQKDSALQLRIMETERLVTLGSIAAAVMHDINQPLAYLITNSQRLGQLAEAAPLLERADWIAANVTRPELERIRSLASELPEIAADMNEGSNVILQMTRTMQRFSKPAADIERVCDPLPVVRYSISVCRDIALRARGTIVYDGPSSLARVKINSTELIQVLVNIVSNAAHALIAKGKPGGRVVVSPSETPATMRVVVTDEGDGMTPEVLARVGTPFYSTRANGTGLGVMQARKLVEAAGGTFKIDSTVGVGTSVTVTLPRA